MQYKITLMLEQIRNFYNYFNEGLKKSVVFPKEYKKIHNVLICGMGGSAIAGDVVKDVFKEELKIPIEISRSYELPAYVNENSLVICVSYSGNTRETLSQLKDSLKKKAKIVCVSSNGKMKNIAERKNLPFIAIPKGMLPRVAFPFLLSSVLLLLKKLDLIKIPKISLRISEIERKGKIIAKKINKTFPIIVCDVNSVAFRWKTQLNENAKWLSKNEILPEIHHNEVESWRRLNKKFSVILLRVFDKKEIRKSLEIDKKIARNANVYEIVGKGKNKLEKILYLILLGDFVSFFLAELNKTNPYVTHEIDKIKKYLAR